MVTDSSNKAAASSEYLERMALTGGPQAPRGAILDPKTMPNKEATGARATPDFPWVAPLVFVCEHDGFGGAQWITSNGWNYVGDWWNDKISSLIVVSGRWAFYEHRDYGGARWELGPGYYPNPASANIPNDTISSFRPISW